MILPDFFNRNAFRQWGFSSGIPANKTRKNSRRKGFNFIFDAQTPFMRIRLLFVLSACLVLYNLSAQRFILGWSGAYATPHELNRELYVYNAINRSGLKKEMKMVHLNQGPAIGMRFGDEKYFELLYSRKRSLVASEFDSSGVAMTRQLKVLLNTWNFGIGINKNGWGIGTSIDLGRFKGKGRRGPEDGIKDQDFKKLWVLDSKRLVGIAIYQLTLAETFYVERSFGNFMGLRLYAQIQYTKIQMDGLDAWLFGGGLNYAEFNSDRFNNYGAMLYFNFGKN